MPSMYVVDRDGVEHRVEAHSGSKMMEVLRELDYGVAAICGGTCSCATCHIYVDPAWLEKLPAILSEERELLAALEHAHDESRLACQIELTEDLAGIRITIAPEE